MRVLVLGGDGFCGWPAALQLSADGHHVWIADNLARRQHDEELGTDSLTPITTPEARLRAWKSFGAGDLEFALCDAGDYGALRTLLQRVQPEAVIHYAEQRAAPYSMKSPRHRCYTLENNLRVTHNLLCALVELRLDAHLVHLGTMGVYGYGMSGITLPEGYVQVQFPGDTGPLQKEIRFPDDPGSLYHVTKCLDQQLFAFYNKNDGLRITDLHQGIVWGTQTNLTLSHPDLINRFDYDGDFGTVLNRFAVQAVVGSSAHGARSRAANAGFYPPAGFRPMYSVGPGQPARAGPARSHFEPDDRGPSGPGPGSPDLPMDRCLLAACDQPSQGSRGKRVAGNRQQFARSGAFAPAAGPSGR